MTFRCEAAAPVAAPVEALVSGSIASLFPTAKTFSSLNSATFGLRQRHLAAVHEAVRLARRQQPAPCPAPDHDPEPERAERLRGELRVGAGVLVDEDDERAARVRRVLRVEGPFKAMSGWR